MSIYKATQKLLAYLCTSILGQQVQKISGNSKNIPKILLYILEGNIVIFWFSFLVLLFQKIWPKLQNHTWELFIPLTRKLQDWSQPRAYSRALILTHHRKLDRSDFLSVNSHHKSSLCSPGPCSYISEMEIFKANMKNVLFHFKTSIPKILVVYNYLRNNLRDRTRGDCRFYFFSYGSDICLRFDDLQKCVWGKCWGWGGSKT